MQEISLCLPCVFGARQKRGKRKGVPEGKNIYQFMKSGGCSEVKRERFPLLTENSVVLHCLFLLQQYNSRKGLLTLTHSFFHGSCWWREAGGRWMKSDNWGEKISIMPLWRLSVLNLILVVHVKSQWASMHIFSSCLQEQRWGRIQHGKKPYQENEYLIACVSVYFHGKLHRGLTLVLLRSVGVAKVS